MIYDDVLPQDVMDELFEYVNSHPFRVVHDGGWRRVWRIGDGLPLTGKSTFFRSDAMYREHEDSRYPTATAIDKFIDAVRELANQGEGLLGDLGEARNVLAVKPWIYPRGAGLSLHRDRGYAGAFTFYLHREWNFHWGGYLLVLDPSTGSHLDPEEENPKLIYPWLSDGEQNRIACDPGVATCIMPKPNRLVFMCRPAYHMVTRVDPDAGDRPRISIGGFFLRPDAETVG